MAYTEAVASPDEGQKVEKLKELIAKVNESEIASIKSTVAGVIEIINNPRSNAKDLKELIEVDPPLTAKVLRIANSAFYASPRRISEIDQAVIWIGFDALKEIVLSQKVVEIFHGGTMADEYSRPKLWKHSLAVAMLAKLIYRREFGKRGENAYAGGLIHDIGIIVEDQFFPEEFVTVIHRMTTQKTDLAAQEQEILGLDHTEIGRVLGHHWGLPGELTNAIGFHHRPTRVMDEYQRLTQTLFLADYFTFENKLGYGSLGPQAEKLASQIADELQLTPYALSSVVRTMLDDLKRMEDKGFFA